MKEIKTICQLHTEKSAYVHPHPHPPQVRHALSDRSQNQNPGQGVPCSDYHPWPAERLHHDRLNDVSEDGV